MLGLAPASRQHKCLDYNSILGVHSDTVGAWVRRSCGLVQHSMPYRQGAPGRFRTLVGRDVMKRLLVIVSCCSAFLLLATTQSAGCGDKVLALGRAVKLRYVSAHLASILVYERSGSPGAAAMSSDPSLQSALKKSSQALKVVHDTSELSEALARGKYDLILADAADAAGVEQQLETTPSHSVVVPVLNQGTKAEASALAKRYHVVLKTPGKAGSYFTALDEAMELKAKRDEAKVLAKR